jgi:hypothetical protein
MVLILFDLPNTTTQAAVGQRFISEFKKNYLRKKEGSSYMQVFDLN